MFWIYHPNVSAQALAISQYSVFSSCIPTYTWIQFHLSVHHMMHTKYEGIVISTNIQTIMFRVFRPLARIMLRQRMTAADAGLQLKQAFIKAAENEIAKTGENPTNARIAIITGLDRNEVSRLRRGVDRVGDSLDESHYVNTLDRAAKVITNWPRDNNGKPHVLCYKGENSFCELVKEHSGGIPAPSMLIELERNKVATQLENKDVRLLRETFIPQHAVDKLDIASLHLERLLSTVDHNTRTDQRDTYLQLELRFDRLNDELVKVFSQLSKEEGKIILQKWAADLESLRQERADLPEGSSNRATGIGLYFFDGMFDDEK